MTQPALRPTALDTLRVDDALALLAQSGQAMPPGEPGSGEWLQGLIDALCALSNRDALTGLSNRRAFEAVLAREADRVARSGEPALLLVLDIDHFKRINDYHGHPAGDAVIRSVAEALLATVRPMDLVARIGGEEFAIILPNCPPAFGNTVAERIRTRVERQAILLANGQTVGCTISAGGAYAPQWVRCSPSLWLERADPPVRPLAPFFAGVGTADVLLDDTRRLKAALDRLGVPCEAHYYPGEIHAFHAMVWRPAARAFWRDSFAFLKRHVQPLEARAVVAAG